MKKMKEFLAERIFDSNFILGIIIGVALSLALVVSPWNNYFLLMFIIWAGVLLLLNPTVNLGFIVTFSLIIFIFSPERNISLLITFIVFLIINFLLYGKKVPENT